MSNSDVRTLRLPDGGTIDIPMPGAKARFVVRAGSMLAEAGGCPRLIPLLAIGIVIGVAGTAAVAWYTRR